MMMTSKISRTALMAVLLILIAFPLSMTAQNKQFTLEDLNFGGYNYRKMQPENLWLTWWGDHLVNTDVEACSLIDTRTGKKTRPNQQMG